MSPDEITRVLSRAKRPRLVTGAEARSPSPTQEPLKSAARRGVLRSLPGRRGGRGSGITCGGASRRYQTPRSRVSARPAVTDCRFRDLRDQASLP
jgi:hypothetical protein